MNIHNYQFLFSLDYGLKKSGLAFCLSDNFIVFELSLIIKSSSIKSYFQDILDEISKKTSQKSLIIIGKPYDKFGNLHEHWSEIQDFAKFISSYHDVSFLDERMTSVLADKMIIDELKVFDKSSFSNAKNIKKINKKLIQKGDDTRAAMVLLNDFLRINEVL